MDFSTFLRRCGLAGEACVLDLDRLFERWRTIPDRRKPRGLRYPLWVLLSIATLAKLAGYHHPQAICDWARLRTQELCRLFRLWRSSMPALSTWNRVFAHALDADALEQVVDQFLTEALGSAPAPGCGVLAMDGKVMRGTIRLNRSQGTHLLALYQPEAGLVLAQAEIDAKANEISAASPLLNRVILRGWVVTGDAMFTQRELSLQIVAAGGHYLWKVKRNQAQLLEQIATLFTPQPVTPGWGCPPTDFTTAHTLDKGHGRIEQRRITVSSMLQEYSDWPHLAQVFKLEYHAIARATGKATHQISYGVTSLSSQLADARRLLTLTRQHWSIENGLHYRRDVTLGEDGMRVCTGHAPYVHAILNNVVLAFLHQSGPPNMAQGHRATSYRVERLLGALI